MQHVGQGVYRYSAPIERAAEAAVSFIDCHPHLEVISLCYIPHGFHDTKQNERWWMPLWWKRFQYGPLMSASTVELIILTRPISSSSD